MLVLDVRAGSFGGILGDSGGKTALFALDGVGHDALGRELGGTNGLEQLVVSVLDLPFLSELVGIFDDGDSVTGKLGTLAVAQDSTDVVLFGKIKAGADHVLEDLDGEVVTVLEINDKLGLLVTDDFASHWTPVEGGGFHVNVGNSVDHVVTPSRDLEDVLPNLDGNGFNERVGVTDCGTDVDGKTGPVVEVRDINQNQVALTVEVCRERERLKLEQRTKSGATAKRGRHTGQDVPNQSPLKVLK